LLSHPLKKEVMFSVRSVCLSVG